MLATKSKFYLQLNVFIVFLCIVGSCFADSLDMQVSRNKIALGEVITVTYQLDSSSSKSSPDFSELEKDFRILSKSYGNSIKIMNGVSSIQSYWQLALEPKKAGDLIIPEINFGEVKSIPRKLLVTEITDNAVDSSRESPVFVKAEVNSTAPYTQSQIVYTFKLFFQTPIENSFVSLPQTKDATFIQLGDGHQYMTSLNGNSYKVVEKKFAVFPNKAGKLVIPPAHFHGVTYDTDPGMSTGPFSISRPKSLSLATQAFNLAVKSIPEKYQGTTWLPARNLVLTEKWSVEPHKWESGTPVTRTIIVEAKGLRADQLPDLAIDKINGMNVYVDTPKRSNNIHDDSVTGKLEQTVTYIPNTAQTYTIPALTINWWNTTTNDNAATKLNSFSVNISGSSSSMSKPVMSDPALNVPEDKKFNMRQSASTPKSSSFYDTPWFWVAAVIFVIWLLTLWIFWRMRPAAKKSIDAVNHENALAPSAEFNHDNFKRACANGNAEAAQQLLLLWAKKKWQAVPLNLDKLCEIINDGELTHALKNLEQAIYSKHKEKWSGDDLYSAFNKFNPASSTRIRNMNKLCEDPLPPLNP